MPPDIFVANCDLGKGCFAARAFVAGERILRFSGPKISFAEAIARGSLEPNPLQIEATTYLDLEPPGVFLNHSCSPNAGLVEAIFLIALRAIVRGEELRFDYSTTMHEDRWTMACCCGAGACRGVVTDFRLLPAERQGHYLRLGVVQPFILRELERLRGIGGHLTP